LFTCHMQNEPDLSSPFLSEPLWHVNLGGPLLEVHARDVAGTTFRKHSIDVAQSLSIADRLPLSLSKARTLKFTRCK